MRKKILTYSVFQIILDNIGFFNCTGIKRNNKIIYNINKLEALPYDFFTAFPQKLWKTAKTPIFLKTCSILLCMLVLYSCTYLKSTKKAGNPALENTVISMNEEEVKKKLGEPDIVSKTPDNHIVWTYRPSWKIMPNNKDTIYIEFEDGKVIKIIKAKK
jgi:hypothetical protein